MLSVLLFTLREYLKDTDYRVKRGLEKGGVLEKTSVAICGWHMKEVTDWGGVIEAIAKYVKIGLQVIEKKSNI